ncbi:hypothetical protein GRF61_20080 [Azoarcus sp. TTM-91]|uniref:hypothetical protein n=1 Tax=Azoarcus sp. TTM-91 TaxID=2691581 RepID=UPI00145CDBEC|nr:hypothetical protein [Azoarcus sp. TTM-91]NMG36754.1 hypothetical protein [Azoarcus sp. TTM-91]
MRGLILFLLAALAGLAHAQGAVTSVCYNYGCASEGLVVIDPARLARASDTLALAHDAAGERDAIAHVIGDFYRIAGEQTPVRADRGGNFADQGVEGRMDCIDHSTSTTRLLHLLEERGWLRFHRVEAPARRSRVLFQHFSAVIEEVDAPPHEAVALAPEPEPMPVPDYMAVMLAQCDCAEVLQDLRPAAAASAAVQEEAPPAGQPGARFAVDSWFVDNGEPAVVLPLADWLDGEGPNVQ